MGQTDAIRTRNRSWISHYNGGAEGLDEELRDEFYALTGAYWLTTHVVRNQSTNLVAVLAERSRSLTGDLDDYTSTLFQLWVHLSLTSGRIQ